MRWNALALCALAAIAAAACDEEEPTVDCGDRGEAVSLHYCRCDPGYLFDGSTCARAAEIDLECEIPEGWPPPPSWADPVDGGTEPVAADQDPLLGACVCPPEPDDWDDEEMGYWSCPCDNGIVVRAGGVDYCAPDIPGE